MPTPLDASLGIFTSEVYALLCSLEPGAYLSPTQILDQLGYPETDRTSYYAALRSLAKGALAHCVDRSPPIMRFGKAIRHYRWRKPSACPGPSPSQDLPTKTPYFLQLVAKLQTQIDELHTGVNELRSGLAELRSEMAKLRACLPSP